MRVSQHLGRILCGKYQGTLLITYDLISKWCLIHPASTCSYHGIYQISMVKRIPPSPSTRWMRFNFRPPLRPTPPKAWLSHRCRCQLTEGGVSVVSTVFKSKPNAFFGGTKTWCSQNPPEVYCPCRIMIGRQFAFPFLGLPIF